MPSLYLISPEAISDVDLFLLQLREVFELEFKPSLFQLRLKNIESDELELLILSVRSVCEEFGVEMILNDNISLALKYDVGVHVGSDDASLEELNFFKKNSNKTAGVSCYNSIERAKMFEKVADYISFGAIFQSSTKKNAPVCEKSTIVEFAKISNAKISIIGGVTAENMAEIAEILPCVDYVCVISEVWGK
jgi:thiamine-phosphate pyrophosphorylase